jgi:hypothetical protein
MEQSGQTRVGGRSPPAIQSPELLGGTFVPKIFRPIADPRRGFLLESGLEGQLAGWATERAFEEGIGLIVQWTTSNGMQECT